jgi:hypothetical protein
MSPFRTSFEYSEFQQLQVPDAPDVEALPSVTLDGAVSSQSRSHWWQFLERKRPSNLVKQTTLDMPLANL